jgi:MFS family permease
METMPSVPSQQISPHSSRLHGIALAAVITGLMLSLLLEALDQTVVGTALPKIVASLHGFDRYTWVVTAYILASTTMISIAGKLSDQFGHKWFLLVGTTIFLNGPLISALVTDTTRWRWVFYEPFSLLC